MCQNTPVETDLNRQHQGNLSAITAKIRHTPTGIAQSQKEAQVLDVKGEDLHHPLEIGVVTSVVVKSTDMLTVPRDPETRQQTPSPTIS